MRKLILLGAGATHLSLLAQLALLPANRKEGLEIALISPYEQAFLNQDVWSILSGDRLVNQAGIDVAALTRTAKVRWYASPAYHLNAKARKVDFSGGQTLDYDVLSLNTGSGLDHQQTELSMPGARANSAFLQPHEIMLQLWPQFLHWAQKKPLRIAVIGQTQAGFELACLLAQRLPACRITWLAANAQVQSDTEYPFDWWQSLGTGMRQRLRKVLDRHHVTVLNEVCVTVDEYALQLKSGSQLLCDASWVAVPRQAPRWLRPSGLALDANGFLRTNVFMQCESDPSVFAVGDVTSSSHSPTGFGVEAHAWQQANRLLHNLLAVLDEDSSAKLKRSAPNTSKGKGVQLGQQRLATPLLGAGWLASWAWRHEVALHRQLMQKVAKQSAR